MVLSIGHGHQLVAELGRPPFRRAQRTVLILALSTNWSFHAATGHPYSVGVWPEGVIGNAQSIQRDRPAAGRHQ